MHLSEAVFIRGCFYVLDQVDKLHFNKTFKKTKLFFPHVVMEVLPFLWQIFVQITLHFRIHKVA